MRSIDVRTPKGLPQRMHSKGSSSLSVTALIAVLVKLRRGSSAITFSGQVARQRPHCTQASSRKPSHDRFSSSSSAPVGQAETQARQRVQPAVSTAMRPKGAPGASGRSEEHTCELQPIKRHSYAVYGLKKK